MGWHYDGGFRVYVVVSRVIKGRKCILKCKDKLRRLCKQQAIDVFIWNNCRLYIIFWLHSYLQYSLIIYIVLKFHQNKSIHNQNLLQWLQRLRFYDVASSSGLYAHVLHSCLFVGTCILTTAIKITTDSMQFFLKNTLPFDEAFWYTGLKKSDVMWLFSTRSYKF